MKTWIENGIICVLILTATAILTLPGCAKMLTSSTTVNVEVTEREKSCKDSYTSDKEQEGLVAKICGGEIKSAKAGTLESVVAGVTALQRELVGLMNKLADGAKVAGS